MGEIGEAGGICRDMVLFRLPAVVGLQVGDVEDAMDLARVAGALCGEGLDVVGDAILERDGGRERVELRVFIVDDGGVGEVDGEDADALGSCATRC